jgi:hypothetical protein
MNQENEQKLVEKYPQIFKDYRGLECGDGWFDLIDQLCADIMATNPPENLRADQVKEKFGGLRFYASGITKEIYKLIDKAETKSFHICERCGSTAHVTNEGGWLSTLCAKCRKK